MFIRLLLFLACALPALPAQDFNPTEIFGPAWSGDAEQGTLALPLRDTPLPGFVDIASSGSGPAHQRVTYAQAGLVVSPGGEQGTVELGFDLGAATATASLQVIELDKGGRLAWHLRGLGAGGEYIVEIARGNKGFSLAIRVRNGARFTTLPGASAEPAEVELPAQFTLEVKTDSLGARFGAGTVSARAELPRGTLVAIAVTDQRARVHTLAIEAVLAPEWKTDAMTRIQARKALERLREFATAGLLAGIRAAEYPGAKALLAAYSDDQRRQRGNRDGTVAEVARALAAIANDLPENALAAHEAGVAALLAGMPAAGYRLLDRAVKQNPTAVSQLALAEACRRMGKADAAQEALARARKDLPNNLSADATLIEARLLADKGLIGEAFARLNAEVERNPENLELAAFADSARMLTQPPTLAVSGVEGPFGVQLISDMPDDLLRPVVARLQLYVRAIRDWLPALPDKLTGRLVIFSGPVDYLSAALLVAGDHLDNVAGMFLAEGMEGKPTILACRAFGEDELTRTLAHELWHMCVRATGAKLPRWLDEGMAVHISAGRVQDGRLLYDTLPVEFAPLAEAGAQTGVEDISRALNAKPWEFYQSGDVRQNYAAGWAAVWGHARDAARHETLRKAVKGDTKAIAELSADASAVAATLSDALKTLKR
ncbi:MAG: hypothetical protein IT464_08905 [Planctomycetes bacterium]|nr:hypothetical protein [Planctomycetota bacterium]